MIQSFANKETAAVFVGRFIKRMPHPLLARAKKCLEQLDAATCVEDLRQPPSNQLEKLSGDRKEQWSIRINAQWRVCFEWREAHAWQVEIVDYH